MSGIHFEDRVVEMDVDMDMSDAPEELVELLEMEVDEEEAEEAEEMELVEEEDPDWANIT